MTEPRTKTIKTDSLARVEGEGAMLVRIAGGQVEEVKLNIYEPPRFFEAFLRGRGFTEAPDITARICGICPVAYQMSSVHAMEQACGVEVGGQLRALRRLLYCGEWIESHALHVFMLHAPDFLGYPSAIELARDHPRARRRSALELKKTGNELMTVVGGREVHPINVKVGGWYRAPRKRELAAARARSSSGRARSRSRRCASPPASTSPTTSRTTSSSRSTEPGEYPIDRGRIVSNRGLDIAVAEYDDHFVEEHVELVERAPLAADRARLLPVRPARALRARRRPALAARARGGRGGRPRPVRAQPVPQHRRALRRARLRGRRGAAPDRRLRGAGRAGGRRRAARRRRLRLHRGAARDPLPPLRDRRRGHDPRREDRAADLAEPADDRGGPARRGRALARRPRRRALDPAASRRSATTTRASPARRTS